MNSDRDKTELRAAMEEEDITWRSFWNGPLGTGGPISREWNVSGWPTIYVLDEKGVIRFRDVRGEEMDKAVNTLIKKMGVSLTEDELISKEIPKKPKKEKDAESKKLDESEKPKSNEGAKSPEKSDSAEPSKQPKKKPDPSSKPE